MADDKYVPSKSAAPKPDAETAKLIEEAQKKAKQAGKVLVSPDALAGALKKK